ncbi:MULTISPECIES: spore coat protein [unclassified Paenibacillus]|uniref:spore coat protein n=1 Tax=unclassified Paenibacillus TaxID=185978 RepID=UPI000839A275
MNQQQNQSQGQQMLNESDYLNVILSDLKRTVREYTTATTESACPVVRRMFTDLTNSTLRLQGELFQVMEQNQMYTAPSPAPRQMIDKEIQTAQQDHQQAHQMSQQHGMQSDAFYHQSNVQNHNSNVQNPYLT